MKRTQRPRWPALAVGSHLPYPRAAAPRALQPDTLAPHALLGGTRWPRRPTGGARWRLVGGALRAAAPVAGGQPVHGRSGAGGQAKGGVGAGCGRVVERARARQHDRDHAHAYLHPLGRCASPGPRFARRVLVDHHAGKNSTRARHQNTYHWMKTGTEQGRRVLGRVGHGPDANDHVEMEKKNAGLAPRVRSPHAYLESGATKITNRL